MSRRMTHTSFAVLSCLAGGTYYGYAMMQQVPSLSVRTIYDTLERYQAAGLVQYEGDHMVGGRLRRVRVLTPAGKAALRIEADLRRKEAAAATARLDRYPGGTTTGGQPQVKGAPWKGDRHPRPDRNRPDRDD